MGARGLLERAANDAPVKDLDRRKAPFLSSSSMSTDPTSPSTTASREQDRQALERTAHLRAAIRVEDTPPYKLNATVAAGTALTTAERLEPLREQLLKLPEDLWDIAHLDHLPDLARALRCVDTELRGRSETVNRSELATDGYKLRGLLLSHAEALVYKELVAEDVVARVREGSGYRDLIEDLNVLVLVHAKLPAGIVGEGMTVSQEDLDRASSMASALTARVANGAMVDLSPSKLSDERRKLGALLLRAQDELRRAMTFLRWAEGDAAKWVPTLYVTGAGRKAEGTGSGPPASPADAASIDEALRVQAEAAAALAPEDNPFDPEA